MRKLACIAMLLSACVVGDTSTDPITDPDPNPDPDPDPDPDPNPTPTGGLRITATTTTKGGQFAPQNVVAVWLEDAQGTFVKTIDRHSGVRTQHLIAWNAKTPNPNSMDGLSGASRLDHATPLSITSQLKVNQQPIPDGTYTIRMESTESNATSEAECNEGTFTFTKGPNPDMQTGLSNGGFTNVTIDFTPL